MLCAMVWVMVCAMVWAMVWPKVCVILYAIVWATFCPLSGPWLRSWPWLVSGCHGLGRCQVHVLCHALGHGLGQALVFGLGHCLGRCLGHGLGSWSSLIMVVWMVAWLSGSWSGSRSVSCCGRWFGPRLRPRRQRHACAMVRVMAWIDSGVVQLLHKIDVFKSQVVRLETIEAHYMVRSTLPPL